MPFKATESQARRVMRRSSVLALIALAAVLTSATPLLVAPDTVERIATLVVPGVKPPGTHGAIWSGTILTLSETATNTPFSPSSSFSR